MAKKKKYSKPFAQVLDNGIRVCVRIRGQTERREVTINEIEAEIAFELGYSERTMQTWRYNVIPGLETVKKLAKACVKKSAYELGEAWVIRLFETANLHRYIDETCQEIFGKAIEFRSKEHQSEEAWDRGGADVRVPTTRMGSSPPLQLPPRVKNFVDREIDLDHLLKTVQPGEVVTLCGIGGIGKSALASEAVWRLNETGILLERFPDGIIFHNFYSQPQATLALENIARTFGEAPEPTPVLAAQRVLAGRKVLLFFDGTEATDDLPEILSVTGSCGVLMTSRRRLDAPAERHDLVPLSIDRGVALLQAWGKRAAPDTAVVKQICELVGGLPLAIRLVGHYLACTEMEAADYLAWLLKTPLEALDHGMRRQESVTLLLQQSITQVSTEARQVLEVIGLLAPTSFEDELISAALSRSIDQIIRPLGELVNYGLLRRVDKRCEISHLLIHTYVRQYHRPSSDVVRRLAQYYTQMALTLEKLRQDYVRFDIERLNIVAVLTRCAEYQEWWRDALVLAVAVSRYLFRQGLLAHRMVAEEIGIVVARGLGDQELEQHFLRELGQSYLQLGQPMPTLEYFNQALPIVRQTGNRKSESICLRHIATAYEMLGQTETAIQYSEQALTIARETDDHDFEYNWLAHLGRNYHTLGDTQRAIAYVQQAVAVSQKMGERPREGEFLQFLGVIYQEVGQNDEAIACYHQALAISRETGDRYDETETLDRLGAAYRDLGDLRKAAEYFQQALHISQEMGYQKQELAQLMSLGYAHYDLGGDYKFTDQSKPFDDLADYYRSTDCFEQALSITRRIGDRRGEEKALGMLGVAYSIIGETALAIDYYQQALGIAREILDRRNEVNYLHSLGHIYHDLEEMPQEAIQYFRQALNFTRELGDKSNEGDVLIDLGRAHRSLRLIEDAITCYKQVLPIKQEIGDRWGKYRALTGLGQFYEELGDVKQAHDYYDQANATLQIP